MAKSALSRRALLRRTTLFGTSAAALAILAACGQQPASPAAPANATAAPADPAATAAPAAAKPGLGPDRQRGAQLCGANAVGALLSSGRYLAAGDCRQSHGRRFEARAASR